MTKPVADALVVGDFSGDVALAAHGRSYEFGTKDGRPFIRVAYGGRAPETFQVDYTLGAKRYQGYLSTLPDGRIYVLPAFWHVQSGRWVDWKETTPIPDGEHGLRQIWNVNCFNCHATNLVSGFDVASKTYKSHWTEMGIGCEACHGPGREHPASKPAFDNSSANRQLSDILAIFSTKSAAPRRVYDTCAYCHGNKNNIFVGFRAGDVYADYALPFLVSEPIPDTDLQGEFWPDGRPSRFNRPQALMLSGCFKAGAIACTNCHVAHGSRNEHSLKVDIYRRRNGDLLCTQCHTEPKAPMAGRPALAAGDIPGGGPDDGDIVWTDAALERHSFHKAGSEGSRCIGCHMSDVNACWSVVATTPSPRPCPR
jgi:predicted CXXCH cytochrome family protein